MFPLLAVCTPEKLLPIPLLIEAWAIFEIDQGIRSTSLAFMHSLKNVRVPVS